VITAKGQPDVATRMFLSRITNELKIPVLGFVDADPYGLKILSVYMSGSKNMSYDSASLTTPDIMWLGLRPSDLDKYNLPEQCRLDMTENDIKTGLELMKEDFIMKNPKWMKELEIMVSLLVCLLEQLLVGFKNAQVLFVGTQTISSSYAQVRTKKKAEIQALSSFGFQYVTEEYLPRKLREGDWI
jgi:meiotic recombination protein SPO11